MEFLLGEHSIRSCCQPQHFLTTRKYEQAILYIVVNQKEGNGDIHMVLRSR